MPPTHTEIYHSDSYVELIIPNRVIIHNDTTILIIQSGIIIVHNGFIFVFLVFIIVGFVVGGVDTRFHVIIVGWHKWVVVFTHDLVLYTPYCIKIYCFSRKFIMRVKIYSYSTYFLLKLWTNLFMFGTVWCWYLIKVLDATLEIKNTTVINQGFTQTTIISMDDL